MSISLVERAAADARWLLANARRALRRAQSKAADLTAAGFRDAAARRRRGGCAAVNDLAELLEVTRRIAAQTRQRLIGTTPAGATRRVSRHDADAGRLPRADPASQWSSATRGQIAGNDDGVVLDHSLEQGSPADAPQLVPAIERVMTRTWPRAASMRFRVIVWSPRGAEAQCTTTSIPATTASNAPTFWRAARIRSTPAWTVGCGRRLTALTPSPAPTRRGTS